MKVLMLNGSPHVNGVGNTALLQVAKALNEEGIETEIVQLGLQNIRGCIACGYCSKNGKCVQNDIVNELNQKFEEADGLVVSSPVYYGSANGTIVSVLDRMFYSRTFDTSMKVGAAIATARRAGTTATFDELNKYFTMNNMPVVTSKYWNNLYGNNAQQAQQDEEGLSVMYQLGKNMAFLIKCIADGKEKYGMPEKGPRAHTNFIR